MKWPIPSEAKFSPSFQAVRPLIVPPHSFRQILRPIRPASASESVIADEILEVDAKAASAPTRTHADRHRMRFWCRLDGCHLSISMLALVASPFAKATHQLSLFMKQIFIAIVTVALASTGFAQEKTELKDTRDKVSYSIGLDIGSTFKKQKMDINLDTLNKGLKDGVSGAKPLLTEDEVKQTMTAYSKEMTEKQMNANKEAGMKNAAAGEVFLTENKKKAGIKTTASGLQYKVLKEGTGPTPKATDSVTTNYRGTLIDGTEFDSSYKRGEPATFPVSGVIKGWTEALQLMKVGSKYQLFVPYSLAYGERGAGQDIGPNETLIFEVELLGIKAPEAKGPEAKPASPIPVSTPTPKASPK
jgi:FKBP-type peptidyl-prolyl cis-trans isomerase FklB